MTWLDWLIVGLLALSVIGGLRRGFIKEIIDLLALGLAVAISIHYYQQLADVLVLNYHLPVLLAKPGSFLALWIVTEIAASLLLSMISLFVPKILRESVINRLAGGVPALVKGMVALGILVTIMSSLPIGGVSRAIDQSRLAKPLMAATSGVTGWIEKGLGGTFAETFNFLTLPNNEIGTVKTIAKIVDTRKLDDQPQLEEEMVTLVNQERAKVGAKPLVVDDSLRTIARAHSRDMWVRGYFSHTDPDGNDPFARMKAAGITYTAAGENIALAPNLTIAHIGLMHSPEHRANILNPDFGHVGIGIVSAGASGLMVTQDFTN